MSYERRLYYIHLRRIDYIQLLQSFLSFIQLDGSGFFTRQLSRLEDHSVLFTLNYI